MALYCGFPMHFYRNQMFGYNKKSIQPTSVWFSKKKTMNHTSKHRVFSLNVIITIIKFKWLMTKWPKNRITIKLRETKHWAKLLQNSKYSQHTMLKPWKTSWYTVNELYFSFEVHVSNGLQCSFPSPLSGKCLQPLFSNLCVSNPKEGLWKCKLLVLP